MKVEIVYRLRSASCLYFSGYSEDLQLPLRFTLTNVIDCNGLKVVAPIVPGREIARLSPVSSDDIVFTDLVPPCEYVRDVVAGKGFVELQDFLDLRFVSYTERMTGRVVQCYVGVVKPNVLFEGRIHVGSPCSVNIESLLDFVRSLDGAVLGGLRLLGCGFVKLEGYKLLLCDENGCHESSMDEVRRACEQ